MVFKLISSRSNGRGSPEGETVDKCEYVDKSPFRITNDTLGKRLMFSTDRHKILLGQFGAWLQKPTEESFFDCLLSQNVLPNCTRREPVKEIDGPAMSGASYEAQVWCKNYGLVQNSSPPKSAQTTSPIEGSNLRGGAVMSVLNVGVDLGVTSKHQAEIRDEHGKKVRPPFSLSGSIEGFDGLCKHALKDAPGGTELRFICEPTSMSWFPLAVYAISHGHEMVRVKAQKAHDLREYYSKHKKRDKIDAKVLSLMPIVDGDALEEVHLPEKLVQALDRRCRQREKIAKSIASAKTRFKSLYHWVMPGVTSCFEDPFGSRARAFYAKYTNPFKVKQLGLSRLTSFLSRSGRQKMNPELPKKVYQVAMEACKLYESASEYIDFDEIQQEVECELQLLESYEKVQAEVDTAIQRLYEQAHPSKNIETIRGISETLGSVLVGIIRDPGRFHSQSKARGYSGMIPKQDESGESCKKGLRITQEGPPRYRRALYLGADTGRQWDPQLAKIYYDQMVYKGNCHTQAVCAVATHLPARILAVLKEDRPYELRDLEGKPISKKDAKALIERELTVPDDIRQRTCSRKKRRRRKEGYKRDQIRGLAKVLQASRFA